MAKRAWFERKIVPEDTKIPWWEKTLLEENPNDFLTDSLAGKNFNDKENNEKEFETDETILVDSLLSQRLNNLSARVPTFSNSASAEIISTPISNNVSETLKNTSRILFSEEEMGQAQREEDADFTISDPISIDTQFKGNNFAKPQVKSHTQFQNTLENDLQKDFIKNNIHTPEKREEKREEKSPEGPHTENKKPRRNPLNTLLSEASFSEDLLANRPYHYSVSKEKTTQPKITVPLEHLKNSTWNMELKNQVPEKTNINPLGRDIFNINDDKPQNKNEPFVYTNTIGTTPDVEIDESIWEDKDNDRQLQEVLAERKSMKKKAVNIIFLEEDEEEENENTYDDNYNSAENNMESFHALPEEAFQIKEKNEKNETHENYDDQNLDSINESHTKKIINQKANDIESESLAETLKNQDNQIENDQKKESHKLQNNTPTKTITKKPETEKEIPIDNTGFADDYERASVTPHLNLAKQYEIPFHILRQQKNSISALDQKESTEVITRLEDTLKQFGIEGRVIGIQRGPIITRYELKMAPGIKVNRILNLTDELAMALEALRVRIEAPIPGRSTVGIEIPNKNRTSVLLGDIVQTQDYQEHTAELPLPFGKDIAGNIIIEDLAKMPHLLIAGATGSGKSVSVNSFITSLILSRTPEQVRFLLVDPKLVELSHYNDIPHLLHPVITDHQKAILALNWAVEEMERRYEDLAETRVRDIRSYNQKILSHANSKKSKIPPMPYIVVLIDELGDLMMVAGKEVEASIIRLAQKARAVGIHLILATQRPSVDVITALIKANCPARIALQVAQKTDSRTILDSNGAETLLGQGDLLFKHPNLGQLIRAQAPLVLDEEVDEVVRLAKNQGKPTYVVLEDPKSQSGQLDPEDEDLFEEAWGIITESGKASASYLQRRLRIGYNRAARLIEAFEARGMVGPQIGSKPREILG